MQEQSKNFLGLDYGRIRDLGFLLLSVALMSQRCLLFSCAGDNALYRGSKGKSPTVTQAEIHVLL